MAVVRRHYSVFVPRRTGKSTWLGMVKIKSLTEEDIDVLHIELADIVAWYFALVIVADLDQELETRFFRMFDGRCYKCERLKCRCIEKPGAAIDLFNWREPQA